ncbi:hypothetical protein ACJX0J_010359 [Zea mays]
MITGGTLVDDINILFFDWFASIVGDIGLSPVLGEPFWCLSTKRNDNNHYNNTKSIKNNLFDINNVYHTDFAYHIWLVVSPSIDFMISEVIYINHSTSHI